MQASFSIFQGVTGTSEDRIALDVHSITELQDERKVPATDDAAKYDYKAEGRGGEAVYSFASCQGRVLAIRKDKRFVEAAENEEVGVLLDRTCFYAEQGGQVSEQARAVVGIGVYLVD